jgi:hypothetical protein
LNGGATQQIHGAHIRGHDEPALCLIDRYSAARVTVTALAEHHAALHGAHALRAAHLYHAAWLETVDESDPDP